MGKQSNKKNVDSELILIKQRNWQKCQRKLVEMIRALVVQEKNINIVV